MLKLKLQYFGHLMWRANSLEKTLMLRKIEGRRRMGRQRMRWLDGITDLTDMIWASFGSWWCHPAISSSVIPFSSCPQSLPASGSFPMSQLFTWGGQSIGVSAFSIILSKEHPGLISFRMDWLNLLAVQGILKSLLQHQSSKASILLCSAFFCSPTLTSIHNYWKNRNFD